MLKPFEVEAIRGDHNSLTNVGTDSEKNECDLPSVDVKKSKIDRSHRNSKRQ